MELTSDVAHQQEAAQAGRGFAAIDARVFKVEGADAQKWLDDLVTTGVHRLRPGDSLPSLLLDATGRMKCHFLLGCLASDAFMLVQPADQPDSVGAMLSRYVLSSKVTITDLSADVEVFSVGSAAPLPGNPWWRFDNVFLPLGSLVGFALEGDPATVAAMADDLTEASDGIEAWRISWGLPSFPIDFAPTSVPAEAGWDNHVGTIDTTKGCFLGQESVAKIRNLGRPPFRVIALHTEVRVEPGDAVFLDGTETGKITSSLTSPGRSLAIARIRWFADEAPPDLRTSDGAHLALSDPPLNLIK